MIEARNGLLGCEALQETSQEMTATPGFKGRDGKTGLLYTKVVYGASDYPPGTKVWVRNVARQPYDEYQIDGQRIVMIRTADVILAECPAA